MPTVYNRDWDKQPEDNIEEDAHMVIRKLFQKILETANNLVKKRKRVKYLKVSFYIQWDLFSVCLF